MGKKGFTLVETVVSLAVLGVMAVFVTGIFAAASQKTAGNLSSAAERERLMSGFEEAAATGRVPAGTERQRGEITLYFGGTKIRAEGEYLTGVYGRDSVIMRYFLAD